MNNMFVNTCHLHMSSNVQRCSILDHSSDLVSPLLSAKTQLLSSVTSVVILISQLVVCITDVLRIVYVFFIQKLGDIVKHEACQDACWCLVQLQSDTVAQNGEPSLELPERPLDHDSAPGM